MKTIALLLMLNTYATTCKPARTDFITLRNQGITARFIRYGARLVSLDVPDKQGKPVNIVWGFDSEAAYRACKTDPYYGAIIGRYGNRIAKAAFTLNGHTYQLDKNDHGNSLHGGLSGLHTKEWQASFKTDTSVTFTCESPDGEGGYPGKLLISVTYTLTNSKGLRIDYKAITDKTTVLNLTNHAYWNLNGPGSGSILRHTLMIRTDKYTPVDSLLIPTGEIKALAGTPLDFHYGRKIGVRIDDHHAQLHYGKGYDHNFVFRPHSLQTKLAQVTGDRSGITMSVYSDQPGLQFYSGNFMAGKNTMNGGAKDNFRSGFCLETQHYPDSPNQPGFPSTVLRPGETYRSTTIYQFSAEK
jgi:aldose 1-epimerase